jgi:Copper amine oxidase N-terminal domain.
LSKRILGLVMVILILQVAVGANAQASTTVVLNGQNLVFDVPPVTYNNRLLVPMGTIFSALGCNVAWNQDAQTITATKDETKIYLTVGSTIAYKNSAPIDLDTPPIIVEGRVMVPLRFVAESMSLYLNYDPDANMVTILSRQGAGNNNQLHSVEYGNTSGNIYNTGKVAQKGDWIYYSPHCGGLQKIKTDGTSHAILTDLEAQYINVVGDWVYYTLFNDPGNLFRIRTDGNEKKQLNNEQSNYVSVVGDWIYYTNGNDNDKVYKMKTDGSQRTKINDDWSGFVTVVGDWVYYANWDEDFALYKMKTDGSQRTKLCDDSAQGFCIDGEWIYFENQTSLYKIKTDGSQQTRVSSEGTQFSNIRGEWLYYRSLSESDYLKMYKIRLDGTQRTKVLDEKVGSICIVNDWIYYSSVENGELYRMKVDGSSKELVK